MKFSFIQKILALKLSNSKQTFFVACKFLLTFPRKTILHVTFFVLLNFTNFFNFVIVTCNGLSSALKVVILYII